MLYANSKAALRRAFGFFHENAGWAAGRKAIGALELARAEAAAANNGWRVVWSQDEDPDLGDHAYWCADERAGRQHDHDVECADLQDDTGHTLATLCGIIDADRDYRRVVEAELALEALSLHRAERIVGR